jgi:hypothetical protein
VPRPPKRFSKLKDPHRITKTVTEIRSPAPARRRRRSSIVSNKTPFAGQVSSRRRFKQRSQALSMWLDRPLAHSRDGQNPADRKRSAPA